MTDEFVTDPRETATAEARCLQCDRAIAAGEEREQTEDGAFCRSCFQVLQSQVQMAVHQQGVDINWGAAAIGGILGGALGAVIWWGFTVLTSIAFGLVAIVIGFLVGKGIAMFTSGKRSVGLQVMAVAITLVSYFYASFLVNRTFILKALAAEGVEIPLFPGLGLFYDVTTAGFELFDLIFIAIAVWQAWRMTAPFKLESAAGTSGSGGTHG